MKTIPFALPSIGTEEEEAVLRVLRSGWLTTGKEALAFEREFAEAVGAPHALAVSSATAGLHLAIEALGVRKGDKVITSPYTFTSSAEILRYLGADPLFADIDPRTLTLDPDSVRRLLHKHPGVKGIIPIHLGGLAADMEALSAISREHGLFLLEDAAHAFPLQIAGRHAGRWGQAGVFSFYATKTITTGEGGMVICDDPELAKRMSIMRLHGIDRDVWDRYSTAGGKWEYAVVAPGYKYNLSDLAAAIGRIQLKKAEQFKQRRKEIAEYYLEELSEEEALILPDRGAGDHAWHLFILRLRPGVLSIDRNRFIHELTQRGVGSSVHYRSLHQMPYYRERYQLRPEEFPRAELASNNCLSLPIYPAMEDPQLEQTAAAVKEICRSFR